MIQGCNTFLHRPPRDNLVGGFIFRIEAAYV